jgi:hypothetical protein
MIEKYIVKRYFRRLAAQKFYLGLEEEIRSSVNENGHWEGHIEWSYAVGTNASVRREERAGENRYVVTVTCDHQLSTECPSVDRAMEFLHLYFSLIIDMAGSLGWPSSESRGEK